MASSSSSSSESCSSTCPWLLMDRLWFQRSVAVSPHPISSTATASNINPAEAATSNSFFSSESNPSSNTSSSTIDCSDEDLAQIFHVTHGSLPIINITPQDDPDEEERSAMKLTKQARKKTKAGSSSSMPRRLERTLSCKTLAELQQEEVKGFADLGFIFDKEHVTPRMMSVVPGLQSVEEHDKNVNEKCHKEKEEEEVGKGKNRGYLSEAWMVKRPDSPLLRLRMSRHSTTSADMKKHLKLWAKAVASTSSAAHP